MFRHFTLLAAAVEKAGGKYAIEWPQGCEYWRKEIVESFLGANGAQMASFNGCAFDLRSKASGLLLKKPWRIATNCDEVYRSFASAKCTQDHEHGRVEGIDTVATGEYTAALVRRVHHAWKTHARARPGKMLYRMAIPAMQHRSTHYPYVRRGGQSSVERMSTDTLMR